MADRSQETMWAVLVDHLTSQVVSVARSNASCTLSSDAHPAIEDSIKFLKSRLHLSIYGVSTFVDPLLHASDLHSGFGGSADTRTGDAVALQLGLIEHQLCGYVGTNPSINNPNCLPEDIVRGAMLIRVNSLARGHSAVRIEILETLLRMLELNLTPVVPLRGSISASGDLSPLSFIAASICGHPDVRVVDRSGVQPVILTADVALAKHGITPIQLGPKEGLGLINGTAVSASAATLMMHDVDTLVQLSQVLTAMTVEAMIGMKGSFHPFIAEIRPHPGQLEAARNISAALEGSQLAVDHEDDVDLTKDTGVLRQDRYPLRTSPQWLGPQLENIALARQQIAVELNSTTDNPLIDIKGSTIHHGGNFQAMAITAASETTRLALANIGKLSFSQLTELLNCSMNRGLPSCLAGSEPSTNYHCKGLDIHAAAYCAELAALAHPVSTHVQSAEMANQAVNSMALVTTRRTMEAVQVLTLLLASHLYCVVQAIDLRVADQLWREGIGRYIVESTMQTFGPFLTKDGLDLLALGACTRAFAKLDTTGSVDSFPRAIEVAGAAAIAVLDCLGPNASPEAFAHIASWRKDLATYIASAQIAFLDEVISGKVDVAGRLGATGGLYTYVRRTLGVRFRRGDASYGKFQPTIGSSVSRIVEGLKTTTGRAVVAAVLA